MENIKDLSQMTEKQVVWCTQLGSCYVESIDKTSPSNTAIVCRQHVGRRKAKFTIDGKRKSTDNVQSLFLRDPYNTLAKPLTFPRMMKVGSSNTPSSPRFVIGQVGGLYVALNNNQTLNGKIATPEEFEKAYFESRFFDDVSVAIWENAMEMDDLESELVITPKPNADGLTFPRMMKVGRTNTSLLEEALVIGRIGGRWVAIVEDHTNTPMRSEQDFINQYKTIDDLEDLEFFVRDYAEEIGDVKSDNMFPKMMLVWDKPLGVAVERMVCFVHNDKYYAIDGGIDTLEKLDTCNNFRMKSWNFSKDLSLKVVRRFTMSELCTMLNADEIEIIKE
jgi:hypothetical protein